MGMQLSQIDSFWKFQTCEVLENIEIKDYAS